MCPFGWVKIVLDGQYVVNIVLTSEMYKLFCLAMCVIVGNSEAEIVFSCQNLIKNKLWYNLELTNLDRLIRISYAKVLLEDFPFDDALDIFLQANHRF